MAKTLSVKQICEFIWQQEKELGLLSRRCQGVFYWPLIRFRVYLDITQKTGMFGIPHPKSKRKSVVNLLSFWDILKGSVIDNPFLDWRPVDTVIMPHPRQVNGEDIYSQPVLRELESQKKLILYKDWRSDRYSKAKTMDFAVAVFYLVSSLRSILRRTYANFADKSLTDDLQTRIKKAFQVDVDVTHLACKHILYFRMTYFLYAMLFKLKNAKTLYVVTAYTNFSAVAAARDCGMTVIELQHGIFTRYHLGYSYPVDGDHVPYVPNEIRCFGQFWPESTPLPQNMTPVVTGFSYLTGMLEKMAGTGKVENQVMVPSQGPVADDLLPFTLEMAQAMPDKKFIYRLHPSEELEPFQLKINTLSVPDNFRLSSHDMTEEPTTYELMAQSSYQIGVSSTTLLEGIFLGCKAGILSMPSSEYMDPVIARGDAFSADTVADVVAKIDQPLARKPDPYYYYSNTKTPKRLEKKQPRSIAIGIITYKRPQGLERLLASLAEQEIDARFAHYRVRMIVVDNDCTGVNADIVARVSARYDVDIEFIPEKRPGIPHARNASVRAAMHDDAMIFVDDDEYAPPGWLNHMIEGWEETGGDVITGPVQGVLPSDAPHWAIKSRAYHKIYRYRQGQRIGRAFTNNTLVSQRVLKDLGESFDNKFQFIGSSDLHYFMRVHKKGYRIIWWPDTVIKETVPQGRISILWHLKRGFRAGAGDSISRLMIHDGYKILFKIISLCCLRMTYGIFQILLSPLGGWSFFIFGLRKVSSGTGGILGVFDITYKEYKRDDEGE